MISPLRPSLAALTALLLLAAAALPSTAAESPPRTLRWLATGDSYSSGEGTSGNAGACALGREAWGPQAARLLGESSSDIAVAPTVHAACTGHLVGDFYIRRDRNFVGLLRSSPAKGSFLEWTRELTGEPDPTFDVISLTIGGNDLDFGDTIIDCNVWAELPSGLSFSGIVGGMPGAGGCDVSEQELNEAVGALAASDRFQIDDGGPGGLGGSTTGSMADFYATLASEHLNPGGVLVVLGYPRLFAPSGEWKWWYGARCAGINRDDTDMLGRVTDRLDQVLGQQAAIANTALQEDKEVVYASALDLFGGPQADRAATEGHELCGNGADWLHGYTLDGSNLRVDASFHPNDQGHEAQARLVADLLATRDWQTQPASGASPGVREVAGRGIAVQGSGVVTTNRNGLRRYDRTGSLLEEIDLSEPTWSVAVADGRAFATELDGTTLHEVDLKSQVTTVHTLPFRAWGIDSDGSNLAIGSNDDVIGLLPVTDPLRPERIATRQVGSFALFPTFTPDGSTLVVAQHTADEGPGSLVVVQDGVERRTSTPAHQFEACITGDHAVTVTSTGTVAAHRVGDLTQSSSVSVPGAEFRAVACAPDGRVAAADVASTAVHTFRLRDGQLVSSHGSETEQRPRDLVFDRNGTLWVASEDIPKPAA